MLAKKKLIVISLVILLPILSFAGYRFYKTKTANPYVTETVKKQNISQEVSATGQVKKGEEINLGFKSSGTIKTINVKTGDWVEQNQILAKLDASQLEIQLQESLANLSLAQAKLDKLLAGATKEEIAVKEAQVSSAKTTLVNAEKNLVDITAIANESLESAYEDGLTTLDDAYLKINNSANTISYIQRNYFFGMDQESFQVKEIDTKAKQTVLQIKSLLDSAKNSTDKTKIETSLAGAKTNLEGVSDNLAALRAICEGKTYRTVVSSASKALIDDERGYINTTLTNVVSAQQTIVSTRLDNQSDINTAEATVSTSKETLSKAEKDLALTTAKPRQEDVNLNQAQVSQAEANANLLRNQIRESEISAPIVGQVTKVEKEIGEVVQPSMTDVVISLLPKEPFQIEVDIAETDIGKISLGDNCQISLDAFPEKYFDGKVIEIDPAATVIQGVVYYRVKISLETEEAGIKPGMTASVEITTDYKENILAIPQRAVLEKNSHKIVKVMEGKNIIEKTVETGIRSSEGIVEIISGLREGETIVTFEKK